MTMVAAVWMIVAIALLPVALLLVLPLVSDLCSIATLTWTTITARRRRSAAPGRQRLLVLVAAHNEELLITDAVRSMIAMHRRNCDHEVIVVSDNSTDRTAELAAAAGARVMERFDGTRRGKPWALLWAMDQLPLDDYDAVVIVDADTVVDADFADAFARRGPLRAKAVQSYCAISNEDDSWLTLLGGLLVTMRYDGQYALKQRVGLNCPIGNGWCLGTDLLRRAGWAPTSLTETWELYARYTAMGAQVDYAADAIMRGQETHTLSHAATQRRRWQAGKLIVFRRYWSKILRSREIGWRQKLDAFGELAAQGPVLHVSIALPLAAVLGLAPSPLARAVAVIIAGSMLPTIAWTLFAWLRHPRKLSVLLAIAHLPVYAMWRLLVAVQAFATARSGNWERSPRHISA